MLRNAVVQHSTRRLAATLCLLSTWTVFACSRVQAQVDPRGSIRTLATPHFRVHVRAGHEAEGRRAATLAEEAWRELSNELAAPRAPIDLVIANNVDYSNGFAQTFPTNRVVIYDVAPVDATELRYHDDWLRLVITHELTHIFHLDRARGLWRVGRAVFGRNPVLFPNDLVPSWVKEGLAVYYESLLTGSGRVVSSEMRAYVDAAAREGVLPRLDRWSASTSQYPGGQTAYAYGSTLMTMAARRAMADGGAKPGARGMRAYVDQTAAMPIPYLLNFNATRGFGMSFAALAEHLQDSLRSTVVRRDSSDDARWRVVANDGFDAESPRWLSNDSVLWVARTAREVTGLYVADVRSPSDRQRVARRNSLAPNAPFAGDSVLFAQYSYENPYEVRSDLYRARVLSGAAERVTHGARLVQPDARRDGEAIAIQLGESTAQLVRVARDGSVRVLRRDALWADPRWSVDGRRIAAVQLLPTGESRVMVLDTNGVTRGIVTGGNAVFAAPTFTPDGARLIWTSDRSGQNQLETARLVDVIADVAGDTISWRSPREAVRQASRVATALYMPAVSPDGRAVVAVMRRASGLAVVVAPLDTTGEVARNAWYPTNVAAAATRGNLTAVDGAFGGYQAMRQLVPRYWMPVIGTGRKGASTYGLETGANDVLSRHAWDVSALINPSSREVDGSAAYRYAGIGVPVLDVSWSQEWDATFGVIDSLRRPLGELARRRRFTTLAATWSSPGYRRSMSAALGVQYEQRDFTSTVDSLLGSATSLLRRGTRYPSVFVNTSISTARRGTRGISVEEGLTLQTQTSYRWRDDAPGTTASWRESGTLRGYLPLNWPGFSRHVLMARVAGAVTDVHAPTEFSVGGVSGISTEIVPGIVVGDPSRTFPVRGVAPGVQRGNHALGGSVEYRAPLTLLSRVPGPFTLFFDRLSITAFSDAARAWCPAAQRAQTTVCLPNGVRDGWLASAGAELVVDLAAQYDAPYRLRIGAAAPYTAPRGVARSGAFYVTLGSFF